LLELLREISLQALCELRLLLLTLLEPGHRPYTLFDARSKSVELGVLRFNCSTPGPANKSEIPLFVILWGKNLLNAVPQTRVCTYFHLRLLDNFLP